jgi:hypothetical protein
MCYWELFPSICLKLRKIWFWFLRISTLFPQRKVSYPLRQTWIISNFKTGCQTITIVYSKDIYGMIWKKLQTMVYDWQCHNLLTLSFYLTWAIHVVVTVEHSSFSLYIRCFDWYIFVSCSDFHIWLFLRKTVRTGIQYGRRAPRG